MKALIVDDDKYVRIGLKKLIPWSEMNFYEVYCADNGETAYDIVMKAYPDLIITDLRMPVMNGIELYKKIYEANVIDIYIIMLSAYDEFEFARAAITYNVKDYVLKPLDDDSISKLTARSDVSLYEKAIIDSKNSVKEFLSDADIKRQ